MLINKKFEKFNQISQDIFIIKEKFSAFILLNKYCFLFASFFFIVAREKNGYTKKHLEFKSIEK